MKPYIGIVGAGVMGKGVAERFAKYGYKVILIDKDENVADKIIPDITRSIKMRKMFDKTLNGSEILENIRVAKAYSEFKDIDFLIENVAEQEKIKKSVYETMDEVVGDDCIYLANTSCIPITRLGSYTKRPDKVIGVHFMNPAPVKNFAEVIPGYKTSEDTKDKVFELLTDVGIEYEAIHDSAGFVSNRLSHLFMNEAAFLVYESIAEPKQIDNIFKKAFGHKMGPLETADLIGLDTVMDSLEVLYKDYEDSKFRVCPLIRRKVEMGECGKKSKNGFYKY